MEFQMHHRPVSVSADPLTHIGPKLPADDQVSWLLWWRMTFSARFHGIEVEEAGGDGEGGFS